MDVVVSDLLLVPLPVLLLAILLGTRVDDSFTHRFHIPAYRFGCLGVSDVMVEFVRLVLTANHSNLPVVGVAARVLRYQQIPSFNRPSLAACGVFENKRPNTEKHHLVL